MQRVEVHVGVPSGGYSFKLIAVYQVENKLIAISKISTPNGAATASLAFHRDMAVVKTGSQEPLEVVNYLINDKRNREKYTIPDYVSIASEDDIRDMLASGKLLYRQRFDHLNALRLSRFEHPNENSTGLRFPNQRHDIANINSKHILNIYTEIDNGFIKIIFETISKEGNRYCSEICETMKFMGKLGKDLISVEEDMLMMGDDTFSFKAMCANAMTTFNAGAVEVYLPVNKPEVVLYFMLLLDAAIHYQKMELSRNEDATFYTHIQISRQSILSCFDDLLVSNIGSYYRNATIENEMSQSLEDFLARPGTLHDPDSAANHLLVSIMNDKNLPAYQKLQDYLRDFYTEHGLETVVAVSRYLSLFYSLSAVYYSSVKTEKNLPLVKELESILANERYFSLLMPFIGGFKRNAVDKLLESAHYQTYNDNQFGWQCAEFELLRRANYYIRADGTLSIPLQDNPIYQANFSAGTSGHEKFAAQFSRLAKVLQLDYAADNDFHQELIFTPESSLKLRAYGLHINELNLRRQAVNMQQMHCAETTVYLSLPEAAQHTTSRTVRQLPASPAFALLQQAGIHSESAYKLLLTYPHCEEMLSIMRKGKVFTDDTAKNKFIFACLIHASQLLLDNANRTPKYNNDCIDSLLSLYRQLAGSNAADCLLTPAVNKMILENVVICGKVEELSNLLAQLQRLNQAMVDRLFSDPFSYLECWKLIRKFDQSNESLLLLFGPGVNPDAVAKCTRRLQYPDPAWLSKDTFRILVENIAQSKNIIKGFAVLHENGILASHRDQFLQNPAVAETFSCLEECSLINRENIIHSMEDPVFLPATKAVSLCSRLDLIFLHEDAGKLLSKLLSHLEMIPIITMLGERAKKIQYSGEDNREEFSRLYKDLKLLLKCTGERFRRFDIQVPWVDASAKLFKPAAPMTLEECVTQLKEKYAITDTSNIVRIGIKLA